MKITERLDAAERLVGEVRLGSAAPALLLEALRQLFHEVNAGSPPQTSAFMRADALVTVAAVTYAMNQGPKALDDVGDALVGYRIALDRPPASSCRGERRGAGRAAQEGTMMQDLVAKVQAALAPMIEQGTVMKVRLSGFASYSEQWRPIIALDLPGERPEQHAGEISRLLHRADLSSVLWAIEAGVQRAGKSGNATAMAFADIERERR